MQKQEIEYFVRSLRALSKAQFPGQLKERAIAYQTLWLMGMMVIRPLVHRLAETNELHLIYPIANLYLALRQLDHGRVHPLLHPSRQSGRPAESGASYRVRGAAAAAMTVLMEQGGQSAEAAARTIARWLDKKGIQQPSGKPIEWITVSAWRKKLMRKISVLKADLSPDQLDVEKKPARHKDVDVYFGARLAISMRPVAGHDKDGNLLTEPPPPPTVLAKQVLEDGLRYEAPPVNLWGIDEAAEGRLGPLPKELASVEMLALAEKIIADFDRARREMGERL